MATKKSPAKKKRNQGASEEIRKEMHAAKAGELKSDKQAIAIGLSKARRAGKDVSPPKKGTTSEAARKKAKKDIAAGKARKTATKTRATKKAATKKRARKSATKRRA